MRAFGPVSYLFLAEWCGRPDPRLRLASGHFREGAVAFWRSPLPGSRRRVGCHRASHGIYRWL